METYIHPNALVESREVGEGCRIWAFSHVMPGAVVGRDCNIGEHVFIESGAVVGNGVTVKNGISLWDGVQIGDEVFLGPHAVFTNYLRPRAFLRTARKDFLTTRIDRSATIGAGAVIVCGIRIGEFAFVAAGAVVTKDVPAHAFVKGNPARVAGRICRCAHTIVESAEVGGQCEQCEFRF